MNRSQTKGRFTLQNASGASGACDAGPIGTNRMRWLERAACHWQSNAMGEDRALPSADHHCADSDGGANRGRHNRLAPIAIC